MKTLLSLLTAVAALSLLGACSTQAWYDGVRQGAANDCRRQPGSAADDCLNRINQQDYRDYEKERSGTR